jgi:hypothetical protein
MKKQVLEPYIQTLDRSRGFVDAELIYDRKHQQSHDNEEYDLQ